MLIELEIIADIEKVKNKKTYTKSVPVRKIFNINEIELEEFVNNITGKVEKKYSGVVIRDKYYKVNTPYTNLLRIVSNKTNPIIGFYQHSNAYKKKNKSK
jgi:hypothetical protein